MIEQYLKPLYEDKDAKKKVKTNQRTDLSVLRIRRATSFLAHSGERRFEGAEEFLRAEFHARQLNVDCSHFHAAKQPGLIAALNIQSTVVFRMH